MGASLSSAGRAVRRLDQVEAFSLAMPPYFAGGSDLRGDHPRFSVPSEALDEFSASLRRSETHYTDVMGIGPLRQELVQALPEWGLGERDSNSLMITAGEQEARFVALQTLLRAGYRLLIPSVIHPGALKAASVAAKSMVRLPVDSLTLAPEPSQLRRALRDGGPSVLYLEVPSRLTGAVPENARLLELLTEAGRVNALVIIDAGCVVWLPPERIPSAFGDKEATERVLLLGALVPGTGVDGWMSGFLAVPSGWVAQARSLKQIATICTAAPVQWAALGALRTTRSNHVQRRNALFKIRTEALRRLPEGVALPGEAATILAVPADGGVLQDLPARGMPGEAFGRPGVVRFTVTPGGEIVEVARAIRAGLRGRGERPS